MSLQETPQQHGQSTESEPGLGKGASAAGDIAVQQCVGYKTPEEQALGRIEHLDNVIRGQEDFFRVYFVLDLDHHSEMHDHFLLELGLESTNATALGEQPEPTIIHIVREEGEIDLVRTSQYYTDGLAYDVSYSTQDDWPKLARSV